jgi:two-component sensor histidine kinase
MIGLGEADVPDRLAPLPVWASQVFIALACSLLMIAERFVIDLVAPGTGPYSLMYPFIMIATLFGRWPSGALTAIVLILFVWYFVLPPAYSFEFAHAADMPRTIVNAGTCAVIVALAEFARRSFRSAVKQRNATIREQALLLREIDHRVKNNFAIVTSLLGLQQRQAADPATQEALASALARVDSIARAHNHLYDGARGAGDVDMQVYISELCAALGHALFLPDAVKLHCACEPLTMQRDRAVAAGLVVNELVTNAAKHAFSGRDGGEIRVSLASLGGGARLTVSDNGIGMPQSARKGALGQRLIDGFSKQASGKLSVSTGPGGTTFTLDLTP